MLTKTANYTLATTDKVVVFNGSTSLTATLPDPTTAGIAGHEYLIKNIGSPQLTIASAGSGKTIDGASGRWVRKNQSLRLISDGAQWLLLTNGVSGPIPTVRASATNYGATGTSATVTIPATAVIGDFLVAFVGSNYAVTAGPAGWTMQGFTSGSYHNGALYTKTCATGDAGSVATFTTGGSEPWNTAVVAVEGADSSLVGSHATQSGVTSSASIGTATVQGVQPGHLALMFASQRSGTKTLDCSVGTVLVRRTADAALSQAVFTYTPADPLTLAPVFTSPASVLGWGEGIVVLRGAYSEPSESLSPGASGLSAALSIVFGG